uniref:Integrase, catalytic region, zinc finger, CCHC-type, peptidase aspartic, catalytic n=1 Tax=Tanacetum cinerariifolium TaxID=118510 RepID=A0A6L2L9F3_TANCI|nr:integrase, catalytic region, zinc finger, CCHC-type, peptidase aspartic, catalytic [Tanacetum cinerariifolium]
MPPQDKTANPNVNQHGNGNVVAARAKELHRHTKEKGCFLSSDLVVDCSKEEVGIQLQPEEFDLMATVEDLMRLRKKPDISFLYVFKALCYPKNDNEDIGKLGTKGDIGFFIGYSADSRAYRVYNRRIKKIMETMNVTFDELSAMPFEQRNSRPGLQSMTFGQIISGLDFTYAPSIITSQKPTKRELDLLFEAMYDEYIGGQLSAAPRTSLAAPIPHVTFAPFVF